MLQFKLCDINCCCDSDCLEDQIKLFPNCDANKSLTRERYDDACVSQFPYFGYGNGLFCIVKINLPERSLVHQKVFLCII